MSKVIQACGQGKSMEAFSGPGALGGNVYFVYSSNEGAAVGNHLVEKYGSEFVFMATAASASTAIQAALDKCVDSRNDYVIIMPSDQDYDLTATLTMSKKCVHLICPAGYGNQVGSTNAARFHQVTDGEDCIAVSNSAIEIAGIYFKPYDLHASISGVANVANVGVYGCNIHHNTFNLRSTTTSAEPAIMFTGDAGAWGSIESNWFITTVSGATYTSIVQIGASATSARVKYNEITIGDSCVATIGISNGAHKGVTAFNIFSECGGTGAGATGGTIDNCVAIAVYGAAIGNLCAVATTHFASGGTADISFCENYDAVENVTLSGSVQS